MSFNSLIDLVDDNDLEKLRQAGKFSTQAKSKQHTLFGLNCLKKVYLELSIKYMVDMATLVSFAESLGQRETYDVHLLSGFKDLQAQVINMGA